MATFTVTNNFSLRVMYTGNTNLITRSDRKDKAQSALTAADSRALRRGLATLSEIDKDKVDDKEKDKFAEKIKAFSDVYNNTLESGSSSSNESIAKITGNIKKLSRKYEKELSNCGISLDGKGYMSLNESAAKETSSTRYNKCFGKDSEYAAELSKLAKKLSQHIDVAV